MINKEIDALIEAYEPIYQNQVRDFNVLSTIHLSENDHTNILCEILNMQIEAQKLFMKSFIEEELGITLSDYNILVAKTQVPALGTKNKGYIDLLIEGDKDIIIIENKVCNATDGYFQLARYYYSYKHIDSNPFGGSDLEAKYTSWWTKKRQNEAGEANIYIVYLTDVADKEPSENSLPVNLKSKLDDHYIHISYEEHIYDWLKNYVLPKIQYGKTGDAHNSIILYLRELENILGANNSKNEWYLSQQGAILSILEKLNLTPPQDNDVQLYNYWNNKFNTIDQKLKENNYKENIILSDLRDCVLCYRNNIYGKYAPNGWRVYCASNYITFYPLYWLEKFGGSKTSCVHFAIDNWCKDTPMIMLKIHGSACKQYIVKDKDKEKFNARIKELKEFEMLKILNGCDNFENAQDKFQKSNHYYFNLEIDLGKMEPSLEWNPNNQSTDNNFFSKFIESEEIKKLVEYIDVNFK